MANRTYEQAAYELGKQAALAAASWVIDGNTSQAHIARTVALMDDGDPCIGEYLPREPDLSGEFADALTPASLAREIVDTTADDDELGATVIEEIADAYELGVNDHFTSECERILRAALED